MAWDNDTKSVSVQVNTDAIYRRANALGIETDGLTDEEILERINEMRKNN